MSKVIAVYGSPGAGRSTFSVALAAELAKKNQVTMLSTDRVVPMLKVLVPPARVDRALSVGGLFTGTEITLEDIYKRIVFHPKCNNLGYLAFATGDTPDTYSGGYDSGGYRSIFTAEKLQAFYSILLSLSDYVIVDCMSNVTPANDPLGNVAISNADAAVKLLSPSIAGIEYDAAILPLLRDIPEKAKRLTAFGRVSPSLHPANEVREALKQPVEYELMESAEIADFFLSGRLPDAAWTREGKQYLSEVKKMKEALEAV